MSDEYHKIPIIPFKRELKTLDDVIDYVTDAFNCTYGEIIGDNQTVPLPSARRLVASILRSKMLSQNEIAEVLRISVKGVSVSILTFFKVDMKKKETRNLWHDATEERFHAIKSGREFNRLTKTDRIVKERSKPSIGEDTVSFEDMSRIGSANLAIAIGDYFRKYHQA